MTRRQHQLLDYLAGHLNKTGVCPSFDEMKDALGLKAKSGIHRIIHELVEREYIFCPPRRWRAIEVLRLPLDLQAKHGKPRVGRSRYFPPLDKNCEPHRRFREEIAEITGKEGA